MKNSYIRPDFSELAIHNGTILCASYADTEDYVGWNPWTDLEV